MPSYLSCTECGKRLDYRNKKLVCAKCLRKRRQRLCYQCRKSFYMRHNGMDALFCSIACYQDNHCRYNTPEQAAEARKASSRARKIGKQKTWDGVPDRKIFERDGGMCQLGPWCRYPGFEIEAKAHYLDVLAPEIDHIIPFSLGGIDVEANKRAAHRACNQARHNKMTAGEEAFMTAHPELMLTPEQMKALPVKKRAPKAPKPPKMPEIRVCQLPECQNRYEVVGASIKKYCSSACSAEANRRRNRLGYAPLYGRNPKKPLKAPS